MLKKMASTRSQLKKESAKPVAPVTTSTKTASVAPANKPATVTSVAAPKSSYSLRPRKVVVTVSHTVSPYNLRPRVKTA